MTTEESFPFKKEEFTLRDENDILRVDTLCRKLLMFFYESLLEEGIPPHEATVLASGADYFLRDFVVDIKSGNILEERPEWVRQFAGNWYIINTIDPDAEQLARHLMGVREFYRFLNRNDAVSDAFLEQVLQACDDVPFYEERIRKFWEISDDGYIAWDRECSLKDCGS